MNGEQQSITLHSALDPEDVIDQIDFARVGPRHESTCHDQRVFTSTFKCKEEERTSDTSTFRLPHSQ